MLSIFIGAVTLFIFGALWYTVLFGKMWASLMQFTPEQMAKSKSESMVLKLAIMFLLNLITASTVYYLFPQLLALSFGEFLHTILIIWVGFIFPLYVGQSLWEGKSWKLVVLNSVGSILSFVFVSGAIYFMQ